MKTFKDLKFYRRFTKQETKLQKMYISILDFEGAKYARINFKNGYGVSVIFGSVYYSNGIDTYEVGILHNNKLTYDTPITDDVIGYQKSFEVTKIMKRDHMEKRL